MQPYYAILVVGVLLIMVIELARGRRSHCNCNPILLDRKLDLLLAHFGIDPAAGVREAVRRADNLIEAIRVYRRMTGADIRRARAEVDRIRFGN